MNDHGRDPHQPKSQLEGVVWPAVMGLDASQLLATLFQLEQSQWWSEAELAAAQLPQLQSLLRHAGQHVPWYAARFREAGFDPSAPFGYADFRKLPLLTRREVQTAGESLFSSALPKLHLPVSVKKTTGSTGEPVTVRGTRITDFFWNANYLREYRWHRRDLRKTLGVIRFLDGDQDLGRPPGGTRFTSWGPPINLVYPTGPMALLSIAADVGTQADWLLRQRPAYLLTYPSNLKSLVREIAQRGAVVSGLLGITTISETVGPDLREDCARVLGAPITDIYSSQEFGYLAVQCPESDGYHVQSESVYLEVLDDEGRPTPPGEAGRVVATSLHNFAMPLIRYEVGDYAIPGQPCACGRGLPVLKQILGRRRNLVTLPNGQQRWPTGLLAAAAAVPIHEIQLIQKTLQQIEVRLVPRRPFTPSEEVTLKEILARSLGHPFDFTLTFLDSLGPKKRGKFEEFVSELG
jgi:phenylacetate-CoA ligase